MNANDAELSLVVPKVVHKLKLRLAVEKLKTLADKSANPTTRQLSGNLTTIRQLSVNRTSKQAPANSTIKQLSANLTTIRQLSVNRTSKQAPANSTIVSQPDNHQAIVSQPYIQASTSQLDNQTIVSQPDNHQTIVSQPYIQASISQLDNQPSVSQPHNEPTIESWTIDLADLSQVNFLHSTSTTGNPLREVLASSCTGSTILGKSELTSADRRFITAAIVEACLKKLNKPSATVRGNEWVKWSNYVKDLFPNEEPTIYYTPFRLIDGKGFPATGYIVHRLIHVRRSLNKYAKKSE
ncbi:hypothetical protein M8J75_001792 [Diaphorina citri]|nr:hypothetical protein M8J75_001792 [Diaphorina citri]